MRLGRWVGPGRLIAAGLLGILLAVRVYDPPLVEDLRVRAFDLLQAQSPRTPSAERPVAIVDIDEASLQALGQWPWPRTRVAELCRKLFAAGAAVVAFDIVFAEPDRLSPRLLADSLPGLSDGVRADLRAQPDNDAVLAEAIALGRTVVGQSAAGQPIAWSGVGPPPQTGMAMVGTGSDPSRLLIRFPGLIRNIPEIEKAASGRGLFTVNPERDGIVRRVPMILKAGGVVVPTLSLEIIRVLTGADSILVQADEGGVSAIRLPELNLPTDPRGQVWVRFGPHDPDAFIPARDVLAGTVPPERFRDKIVLVGTSAIGLLDNKTTPIERAMPGVEIHAQLLETILTGTALIAPNDAVLIELATAAAVSIAIILVAPFLNPLSLIVLGGSLALCIVYASWYSFTRHSLLFDATFPLTTSTLVYICIVFTNYFREQMARTRIRSAFGRYLSPALVEQLVQSPDKLKLGGEERRLTVMFSDVRGFTTISEFYKTDPAGLTQLMNRFLTPLTNAILDHKGTIDKYMGDAIMAFWNAPLEDPGQERNAAAAALDMLARMDALNLARKEEAESGGHPVLPLDVGIGINTGACVVGNMGSDLRFDYSVLGDPVNLASRLEGQSKFYGVRTILGALTAEAIRDRYAVLEIDRIQVKGKHEAETISTLVGDEAFRNAERFAALSASHRAMLAAYRARRWGDTAARARECRALAEGLRIDGLYRLYEARAAEFTQDPPPADWEGVYVALAK